MQKFIECFQLRWRALGVLVKAIDRSIYLLINAFWIFALKLLFLEQIWGLTSDTESPALQLCLSHIFSYLESLRHYSSSTFFNYDHIFENFDMPPLLLVLEQIWALTSDAESPALQLCFSHIFFISRIVKALQPLKIFQLGSLFFLNFDMPPLLSEQIWDHISNAESPALQLCLSYIFSYVKSLRCYSPSNFSTRVTDMWMSTLHDFYKNQHAAFTISFRANLKPYF